MATGTSGIPWSGYNGNQPFVCGKCGAEFGTSSGHAQHHRPRVRVGESELRAGQSNPFH